MQQQRKRLFNKQIVTLIPTGKGGGEGEIYTVLKEPHLYAKVYHSHVLTEAHVEKVTVMMKNPPNDLMAAKGHLSVAWPVDLLCPIGGGKIDGFLMPRVDGGHPLVDCYNPQDRYKNFPRFDYFCLHRAAYNLVSAVCALHNGGYVIGDVNESNILIFETGLVTLVDTDSFQVRDSNGKCYPCPVGKPEFTPPELQGQRLRNINRTFEHDYFGLAVLIFQLLMEGWHPFDGVFQGAGDAPEWKARIKAGHFPHGNKSVPYRPADTTPPFNILHPNLRQLFVRCFEDGHNNPKKRPNAQEWIRALQDAEKDLVACSVNAQHRYGSHLSSCPWCDRKKQLQGLDPFPPLSRRQASTPIQIPLPPAIPNSLGLGLPSVTPSQFPSQTTNTQKQPSSLPRTPTPPTPNTIAPRTVQPTTPINKGLITVGAAVLVGLAGYWYWISRPDPFIQATEIAEKAVELGKSAKTSDEWFALASQWKQASDMMASIPTRHQYYESAQKFVASYHQNSEMALQEVEKLRREAEDKRQKTEKLRREAKDKRQKTEKLRREAEEQRQKEIASTVGVNYTKLRELLEAEKWAEANEETYEVFNKVAEETTDRSIFIIGRIRADYMPKFPCKDLRTIDRLWVKNSKNHFGFSVQKRVWKSLGGTNEWVKENTLTFNNYHFPKILTKYQFALGWKEEGRGYWKDSGMWLTLQRIYNDQAPKKGQLPTLGWGDHIYDGHFMGSDFPSAMSARLSECNIQ